MLHLGIFDVSMVIGENNFISQMPEYQQENKRRVKYSYKYTYYA
jgi:hypothetical protein